MCRAGCRGFGVIECLIALLLLSIMMAGGVAFYMFSNQYFQEATNRRIATALAQSELEAKRQAGYAAIGGIGSCTVDTSRTVNLMPATITSCVLADGTDSGAFKPYKQVETIVDWTDPGKGFSRSVSLSTFISE